MNYFVNDGMCQSVSEYVLQVGDQVIGITAMLDVGFLGL